MKNIGTRGMSLIDVLFAIGIIMLTFVAIFGGFKLSLELVMGSKARTGAVALANEQIEFLRSLPYDSVGTVGGIPSGSLAQTEELSLNQTTYTRRTFIQYIDDASDGLGAADTNGITADYKRAKVELTWMQREELRSYALVTSIVPKGIESVTGGGTLVVNVYDALSSPIQTASVRIVNDLVTPTVDVTAYTDASGRVTFPGAASGAGYQVTVTKSGHSTSQTYDVSVQNPNPNPGHLTIAQGQTTSGSFFIDTLGAKVVRSWQPIGPGEFEDLFNSLVNIATSSNVVLDSSAVELATTTGGYVPSGELYSATLTPAYLVSWDTLSWSSVTSATTTVLVRLYAATSSPFLIPDSDLPGNSAGFSTSPIGISNLSNTTYPAVMLAAYLASTELPVTPRLLDWKITWQGGPTPLPNIPFAMRGAKSIGTDAGGGPIYKYSQNHQTDGTGSITINNLEWDSYLVTVDSGLTGLDISESCDVQPTSLSPGENETLNLYFVADAANSLLVSVISTTTTPIANASVRLYRNPYDTTYTSSTCGQAFFSSLSSGTVGNGNPYSITVSASGYLPVTLTDVEVSGASTLQVVLDQ